MKAIKTFFIRRRISKSSSDSLLRKYPKSIQRIGVIVNADLNPDTNFITKLKNGFGDNIQIFIFVLEGSLKTEDNYYNITTKDFDLIGNFKNATITDHLEGLELLIDMSLSKSVIKSFIFNLTLKAYKITLDEDAQNISNLCIRLKEFNQLLFADEIIKYHNILRNG